MNCKNYMWLKFVKGLSFKEKCKFSSIRISILLYKQRLFNIGQPLFIGFIISIYYFTCNTERLWLKLSKLNFPWYFPIPEVPTPPKGK